MESQPQNPEFRIFLVLICGLTSVNSYGHVETVS